MTETTAGAFTVPLYSKTAEFQNMYIIANQHKAYLIEKSHFIWESELVKLYFTYKKPCKFNPCTWYANGWLNTTLLWAQV